MVNFIQRIRPLPLISGIILAIALAPIFFRHFPRFTLLKTTVPIIPLRTSSMSSTNYENELRIALLAVQRATLLTRSVFHSHAKGTLSKSDASPVTIGDFGAQALIINALQHAFPEDDIIAEEEAKDLRENNALRETVWTLVRETKLSLPEHESEIGGGITTPEIMLDVIDKGAAQGGNGRTWTIDPIDGTKGFLRGGQYAVCLALLVDGEVKVGVLGCPNLPTSDTEALSEGIGKDASDSEGRGVMFSAVLGRGAESRPLREGLLSNSSSIYMKPLSRIEDATFCESVEAGHSSQGDAAAIARLLGITKPSVRMDSQAKYGSIARGAGDLYLRLPVRKDYVEKIWDHAAGDLIVREAGGQVTDIDGKRLDFSLGRTLRDNRGVIAAPQSVHQHVLDAVQKVLRDR